MDTLEMPSNPEKKGFKRMDFPKGMEVPLEDFLSLEFEVGKEHLTGVKIAKDLSKPADFAYFHGAATGNWSRLMAFAKPIVDQESSIVAFDHSGHGTSTGEEKKASLEKYSNEARAIIDAYANGKPLTVCGSSMGGYTAIKMLRHYDIQNLILMCPGIYDRRAFNVQFDSGFTEILRTPEEDATIPKGVIQLINDSASQTKRKEIVIVPGAPHAIQAWMIQNPDKAAEIAGKMAEFSKA